MNMWSSRAADREIVSWLLAPLTLDDFRESYYERAPLHIARADSAYYDRYFTLREFERIMCGSEIRTTDVKVVRDGTPARVDSFAKVKKMRSGEQKERVGELVEPDRLSALLAGGCSLVLDGAQRFSPSLGSLCRELEMFLRHSVNPNVYFTPADAQGFSVHYDTHDTVIIQVAGTKHWRIYNAPYELPLDDQYFDKKLHPVGDVQLDITVHPGDLLYIPRGVLHEARATDEVSLHVTLGLYPRRWVQVLYETLAQAAKSELLLRKTSEPDDDTRVAEFLAGLFNSTAFAQTRAAMQERFEGERLNGLDGQIEQMVYLKRLNEDSAVAARPSVLYRLEHDEKSTKLTFSGKTLTFGPGAAALIQELINVESTTPRALVKCDENALKVVRKLIQEGFALQLTQDRRLTSPLVRQYSEST
jgi:ribosomal protein L16 Arg81 hydroxylase